MKDYYYILGVPANATIDEIKIAYRKLSHKFHPDKNSGDQFFQDRFIEIQEAHTVLTDSQDRAEYDYKRLNPTYGNTKSNYVPEIEYLRSDKSKFEYDKDLTLYWKVLNADEVHLKPFGKVPAIGHKTVRIKEITISGINIELIAINTNINRHITKQLYIENKSYNDLYYKFKQDFINENQNKSDDHAARFKNNKQSNLEEDKEIKRKKQNVPSKSLSLTEKVFVIMGIILIVFLMSMIKTNIKFLPD